MNHKMERIEVDECREVHIVGRRFVGPLSASIDPPDGPLRWYAKVTMRPGSPGYDERGERVWRLDDDAWTCEHARRDGTSTRWIEPDERFL